MSQPVPSMSAVLISLPSTVSPTAVKKEGRPAKKVLPWMKSGRHFLLYFTGVALAWLVLLSFFGMALGHWVPRAERTTVAVIEQEKEVEGEAPAQLVSVINESVESTPAAQPAIPVVEEPDTKRPDVIRVAAMRQEEARRPLREFGETNQVPRPEKPAVSEPACTTVPGTAVDFVKNPLTAFKQAAAENKLVFMIHLSGNFEDQGFT